MKIEKMVEKFGIERLIDYLYKDTQKNMPEVLDWADKFSGGNFEGPRKELRNIIFDESHPYNSYIKKVFNELDPEVSKKLLVNFFINSSLSGWKYQEKLRKKYQCNIPWTILLDPTSACNLKCIGCWASEYDKKLNLTKEEISSVIKQGKELGIYMYIYTGGEPLVRKKDLIEICEEHNDCVFLCFTNGTLIDEDFANEMLRVKNFVPAISLEGSEFTTDSRRGEGTYKKVLKAMNILKSKGLPYGISTCYTSVNYESVTSEEYYEKLIELGAYFIWYFHYMPVGNNASQELLLDPEQRKYVLEQVRKLRKEKPLFAMDFQNDAQYMNGCIAGGRRYLHINPNGDVEPCVFIHYSDSNIRDVSLLEALNSPLFLEYYKGQPFNENMLRPCPMLENPEKLREIVKKTNAVSTDMESSEDVEHLCGKCDSYSKDWSPVADELWEKNKN